MADENQNQELENQQEQHAADPYEEKALELGWRPKEEWDGPEEDFIEAKEFVRRKPLFDRIESQSKAIKDLSKAMDALKTHYSKVKEVEYERALKTLKEAKKQALVNGETDQFLALEERIEEVESEKRDLDANLKEVEVPQEQTLRPEFVAWTQANTWYQKDKAMTAYADARGIELARSGMSPEAVLQTITREVKQEFPHKFQNPNRNKPGAVENGSRRSAPAANAIEASMSEQEKRIMNTVVRSGALTKEQYLKDYQAINGRGV
jgi:hypothetical protein